METKGPPTDLSREPLHLLSVGPFGGAVARYLRALRVDICETHVVNNSILQPDTWPITRMNILAAWRPVPKLCELLDEHSHRQRRPFIPLVMDSTALRLGPIVVPGGGSCWECWMRRSRQHENWPKERAALLQYYATHPDTGPKGYIEPFAMMGAARLAQTIDALDLSNATPGQIWEIDVMTRRITVGKVIGVHGCSRCGLARPDSTRSVAQMQQELHYLWSDLTRK